MVDYQGGVSLYVCTILSCLSFNLKKKNISYFVDPPTVFKLDQQNIVEGTNLSVTCNATSGNPSTTTFFWTLIGHPFFSRKGSILKLSNIQKNNSGTYSCTAINVYSNGRKGNHSQGMLVNVFCK